MRFARECYVDLTAVVHAVLWTALIADSSAEEGWKQFQLVSGIESNKAGVRCGLFLSNNVGFHVESAAPVPQNH